MIDMIDIDAVLEELNQLAGEQGAVIYDIHFCRAGWGIVWFDETRASDEKTTVYISGTARYERRSDSSLKSGMVVHRYYDKFSEMLAGERERLLEKVAG